MFLQISVFNQQIGNGLILMVLGMGIVFLFLTILVFSTKTISKIVGKIEKNSAKKHPSTEVASSNVQEAEIAAAIAAAYEKFKL